jgi:hypothetical protein
MPTAIANASSRKGTSGTTPSSPKLAASASPAAEMARTVPGRVETIASGSETLRASSQTLPTVKML